MNVTLGNVERTVQTEAVRVRELLGVLFSSQPDPWEIPNIVKL